MIFHRIIVENLFSYRGRQTYEFLPRDEGSVALVIGRNGFGKTSLLNAVKLLFLGTDDKKQRTVGFPPRNLSRNDYVLGMPRGWAGIKNRHASDSHCSVRVELGEPDGVTFTATRSWLFNGRGFEEDLRVEAEGQSFAGDAAEERLSGLLPRELVPFFFFDGEEVQFLAETTDTGRAEAMERLLSLSFITGVEAQLRDIVKTWSREALPQDVQVEIKEHEGRLATVQAEIVALRHKADDKQRAMSEERGREEYLGRRMADMRAGGSVADSRRLEDDIKELEAVLEGELSALAFDLATDAPLLANPGLVKAASQPLTEVIEHKSRAANSVAKTLHRVLPERLFVEPPQPTHRPLDDEQRKFFVDKLRKILESYAVTDSALPAFLDSLDLARARDLLNRFNRHAGAMSALRQDRARRLREVSAKRAQLARMKAELREMQVGGSERAKEYQQLEEDFKGIGRSIGKMESELEQLEAKVVEKTKQAADIQSALNGLERRHNQAAMTGERLGIAVALRETFSDYRQRNRAARREQIEEAVNRHFRSLMTGHHMIDRISIDEDFVMRFLDADGAEFGQLTVSHGMRQLAVTALLWALKEVSGREMPIIVDTPLARIDRANQHNLLRAYYPHAAEQVIILATDSEIDRQKFKLLQPHLGVQFRLENADGQSTHVIRTGTDRLATEQADG